MWGGLIVHGGEVGFVFENDVNTRTIAASGSITIPPGRPHHVVLDQPATFAVEFYRPPGTQSVPAGTESTGIHPQRSIITRTSGDDLYRSSDPTWCAGRGFVVPRDRATRQVDRRMSSTARIARSLARLSRSTTIRMLLGLIQPSARTAAVLGHPNQQPTCLSSPRRGRAGRGSGLRDEIAA